MAAVFCVGVAVPADDLDVVGDLPERAEIFYRHSLAVVPDVKVGLIEHGPHYHALTGLDEAGIGVFGQIGEVAALVGLIVPLEGRAVKIVAGLILILVVGEEGGDLNDHRLKIVALEVVAVVGDAVVVKVYNSLGVVVDLKHLKDVLVLVVCVAVFAGAPCVGHELGYQQFGFLRRPRRGGGVSRADKRNGSRHDNK